MLTYFVSKDAVLLQDYLDIKDTLVKNALILVEGRHTDRYGNVHTFSATDIDEIADNTNVVLRSGQEVPFIFDHAKQLYINGQLSKLGEVLPQLESRVICEQDLPKSQMVALIGKKALFGKVRVISRLDDVRKGVIRLLSPGIDLTSKRLFELSAVLFPAIAGPALFSQYSSIEYTEAKNQLTANHKLLDSSRDCLDVLFSVLRSIDASGLPDVNVLRRKAFTDFVADLSQSLGLGGFDVAPTITAYSDEEHQLPAEFKLKTRKKNVS